MSFLNQLKSQASALQSEQNASSLGNEANTRASELACETVRRYFNDLATQLNVITPQGPLYSLDGKTNWPAMKLHDFRADARKKMHRGKEAFDFMAIGWRINPAIGGKLPSVVRVNFPPDLERVTTRLAQGNITHERKEIRHPEKNTLLAVEFHCDCEARGSITVQPNHDNATLEFRLVNASGFGVQKTKYPASSVQAPLLDELAKLLVGQPSQFL